MTCREVANFLMGYLSGELPADTRFIFDRHLFGCESCRNYLRTYKATVELGRRACEDEDALAAAAGVPEELVQAILLAKHRRP